MVLHDSLVERPDGKYAARQVGLNVPRQNGKGNVLAARELFSLVLAGDRLVTHTAHEFDTSREHFLRLMEVIEKNAWLDSKVQAVQIANGVESIRFKNGGRLKFKARRSGSGRGFSGDLVVMDEAMIVKRGVFGSLIPTMATRDNPQAWFVGSAPLLDDLSDDWRGLIARGRSGAADLCYLEWSVEHGADVNDLSNLVSSNPGLDTVLSREFVLVTERGLLDDETYGRERFGMWREQEEFTGAIDRQLWASLAVEHVDASWLADPVVFGVEGNASADCFTVIAAGHAGDKIGLDVVRHDHGTEWLLDWAIQANETHAPKAWVFDPKSSTADLFMADFRAAGLTVIECGFPDRALPRATAGLHDDICNGRIEHLNHPALDAAAGGATWRFVGESRLWDRKTGVMIAPLVAATLARYGLLEESAPAPVPFLIRR